MDSDVFGSAILHEGSHIADGADWVKSGFSKSANPTQFQLEMDGYTLNSMYADAAGYKWQEQDVRIERTYKNVTQGLTVPIRTWNSGWAAADIETLRQTNIEIFLRNSPLYKKTLDKPSFVRR